MNQLWSQDLYNQAWHFAAEAHLHQTFPGADFPYIVHIGDVAMEVMAAIADKPVDRPDLAVQCALLHDVAEDTPVGITEIADAFGKEVADGVSALTKDESLPSKPLQMEDSLNRIVAQPEEVWMVKLADRTANLQKPPHYWKKEKIAAYHREAILIYERLKEAHSILAERLHQKIDNYRRYFAEKT